MTLEGPRLRHPHVSRLVAGNAAEQAAADRTCSHGGCRTPLSRYNPDTACSLHGGWSDGSIGRPGRKAADAVLAAGRHAAPPAAARAGDGEPTATVVTAPDAGGSEDATAGVQAEVSLELALPPASRQVVLDRLWQQLEAPGLVLTPSVSGVLVSGPLGLVLDAVEELHRLAVVDAGEAVTTLRLQTNDGQGEPALLSAD